MTRLLSPKETQSVAVCLLVQWVVHSLVLSVLMIAWYGWKGAALYLAGGLLLFFVSLVIAAKVPA